MKIKMLKTQRGSVDGIHSKAYEIGTEHELSGKLLKIFLDNKWASEVKEVEKVEVKSQSVPENKMESAPVENKKEKRDKK